LQWQTMSLGQVSRILCSLTLTSKLEREMSDIV